MVEETQKTKKIETQGIEKIEIKPDPDLRSYAEWKAKKGEGEK